MSTAALGGSASQPLVFIGASTGGTEAIRAVLMQMPSDGPSILIVQHMPDSFTRSFAERLNGLCRMSIAEASGAEPLRPGHAYIAPGHSHLRVVCEGARYFTALSAAPAVNRHRPSVDVLFDSAADCAGGHSLGVLLTGMGKDGAAGLLAMKRAGATTFAQDEASCVVYGMPKEAIALGAVDEVLPLAAIARRILQVCANRAAGAMQTCRA